MIWKHIALTIMIKRVKPFNNMLKNISSWANTWQLKISSEKSKWLIISLALKNVKQT